MKKTNRVLMLIAVLIIILVISLNFIGQSYIKWVPAKTLEKKFDYFKSIKTSNFSKIKLNSKFNVYIEQGDSCSVHIYGPRNWVKNYMHVKVEDEVLEIKPEKIIENENHFYRIFIIAPKIESIEAGKFADITFLDGKFENIKICKTGGSLIAFGKTAFKNCFLSLKQNAFAKFDNVNNVKFDLSDSSFLSIASLKGKIIGKLQNKSGVFKYPDNDYSTAEIDSNSNNKETFLEVVAGKFLGYDLTSKFDDLYIQLNKNFTNVEKYYYDDSGDLPTTIQCPKAVFSNIKTENLTFNFLKNKTLSDINIRFEPLNFAQFQEIKGFLVSKFGEPVFELEGNHKWLVRDQKSKKTQFIITFDNWYMRDYSDKQKRLINVNNKYRINIRVHNLLKEYTSNHSIISIDYPYQTSFKSFKNMADQEEKSIKK